MVTRRLFGIQLFLSALAAPSLAAADPQLAAIEGARANMRILELRPVRAAGFSYDHEVTVALPASYDAAGGGAYPVLWVLDSPLMMRLVLAPISSEATR